MAVPMLALSLSATVYWPPVPTPGTPVMLAGFPETNERPLGNVFTRLIVPVLAEIANEPDVPTVNVAVFRLVNTGVFTTVIG
jgi:hypothetical protein